MLKIAKKWNSDIADLRQKYSLVVFIRDNAGENKSHEIIYFIESIGATNRLALLTSNGKMDLRNQQLIQT